MTAQTNQWMLFGFDMRQIGQHWSAAWRDLLFSLDSPLRRRLDEPVALETPDGARVYQGGERRDGAATTPVFCRALLLPEDLVLLRPLTIPLAAESELTNVLTMEVSASSPFAGDDTVSGWQELDRDDRSIRVMLAVASRSTLSRWVSQQDQEVPLDELELWVDADAKMVVLRGFGETVRDGRYRSRLLRCGAFLFGILLTITMAAALFAIQQNLALEQLSAEQARIQREAAAVSDMRSTLVDANETLMSVTTEVAAYPNPHIELARLTRLLGGEEYLAHFSMRGREIRIRGRSTDAAQVMQTLAGEAEFASVLAPQPITTLGTGLEQFHLDIGLIAADDGGGQ